MASCRDGRVRGEHDSSTRDEARFFQCHLPGGPQLADALDGAQEAVSFVEVEDPSRHAERAQRAHTANAEHYLLAKTAVRLRHGQAGGPPPAGPWAGLGGRGERV